MIEEIEQTGPSQSQSRRNTLIVTWLLILCVILVILGGISIALYTTVIRPLQLHAQGTSVVQTLLANQQSAPDQPLFAQVTSSTPSFNDSLSSQHDHWTSDSGNGNSCAFENGSYNIHMGAQQPFVECPDSGSSYGNFIFQIQMQMRSNTWAGILFRSVNQQLSSYFFTITPNGLYNLDFGNEQNNGGILAYGRSAAIHTGLNRTNTLTVLAHNTQLSLYINNQFVISVNDTTYSSGAIGVCAGTFIGTPVDVTFKNAEVWSL
jgi:hypothetical protein